MNYYPFHIGDYTAHTAHLDPMEDIAYRRMLDAYYLSEGPLPLDAERIAKLIRMRDHAAIVRDVLNEFFVQTPAGWAHARCDAEIMRKQEKSDKARTSAGKRWQGESDADAMRTHSEGNAPKSQEPIAKEKKERGRDAAVAAPRSRQIPVDFPGDEEIAWCRQDRPELDAPRVAQVFRDHHLSVGSTMKSWPAAWRKWVGKERATFRASPAADRDAETADFLGRLTGGLAGTKQNREVVDVEPAHVRRIA